MVMTSEEFPTLKVSVSAPHWLLLGLLLIGFSFLQPVRVAALKMMVAASVHDNRVFIVINICKKVVLKLCFCVHRLGTFLRLFEYLDGLLVEPFFLFSLRCYDHAMRL